MSFKKVGKVLLAGGAVAGAVVAAPVLGGVGVVVTASGTVLTGAVVGGAAVATAVGNVLKDWDDD